MLSWDLIYQSAGVTFPSLGTLTKSQVKGATLADTERTLASGAVVSHSLIGRTIFTKTPLDRVGVVGLGLLLIVFLMQLAKRIRGRVQCEALSMQEAESSRK